MRPMTLAPVLAVLLGLPWPTAAQQPAPAAGIPLSQLLNSGFEIKGAVLAGILVQKGTLAYICTTAQRDRPVAWACFPLN